MQVEQVQDMVSDRYLDMQVKLEWDIAKGNVRSGVCCYLEHPKELNQLLKI